MSKLHIGSDTRVIVLTGAGISADSGIPTYRGTGGFWKKHKFEDLASPEGFAVDPDLVWRFYSERRKVAQAAKPNAGHLALARLQDTIGSRFLLITQNVDGLHLRAGNLATIEMHGNLFITRCSNGLCGVRFGDLKQYKTTPSCKECGRHLRPGVVWFGESIPVDAMTAIQTFLETSGRAPLVFMSVGTSGVVEPAASLVRYAQRAGAVTISVNQDEAVRDESYPFNHYLTGSASDILPQLF